MQLAILGVRTLRDAHKGPEQVLPTELLQHTGVVRPVDRFGDAALEINGESLVQPEIVPRRIGHQVPAPTMRQFMCDKRRERTVPCQDRRRCERQPGVLHATERETGREHDHIVPFPSVRAIEPFCYIEHRAHVREFPSRTIHYASFRINTRASIDGLERHITHRQSDEVGRYRLVHREVVDTIGSVCLRIRRAHHRHQFLRDANLRLVREPDPRAVLHRYPTAGEYGLPLGEQERMHLVRRLLRTQPL